MGCFFHEWKTRWKKRDERERWKRNIISLVEALEKTGDRERRGGGLKRVGRGGGEKRREEERRWKSKIIFILFYFIFK